MHVIQVHNYLFSGSKPLLNELPVLHPHDISFSQPSPTESRNKSPFSFTPIMLFIFIRLIVKRGLHRAPVRLKWLLSMYLCQPDLE